MPLSKASGEVIAKQISITAIPRRFTLPMREIWDLQLLLPPPEADTVPNVSPSTPRFRAAYDFVLLREQAGEELSGLGDWWTAYQDASEDMQEQMSRRVGVPRQ